MSRLVLASGSPRRKEFFDTLGVDYTALSSDIDESRLKDESPSDLVLRLAQEKALAVTSQFKGEDKLILGADTLVVLGDEVFGKPASDQEACHMLKILSGKSHCVLGGIALVSSDGDICETHLSKTRVEFIELSAEMINEYVASKEPEGKAGAYAIQGLAAPFVSAIDGSYTNIVGLDLAVVTRWLRTYGLY